MQIEEYLPEAIRSLTNGGLEGLSVYLSGVERGMIKDLPSVLGGMAFFIISGATLKSYITERSRPPEQSDQDSYSLYR